jgi:hypothetical protein
MWQIRRAIYDWLAPKLEPDKLCRMIECVCRMDMGDLKQTEDFVRAVIDMEKNTALTGSSGFS